MNSNEPSSMAWATLIFGIASWVAIPFIGAVGALICGYIERGKMQSGESSKAGETIVLIGMILGGIQLVTSILAIAVLGIFFCGIPCLAVGAGV
jgi:hypothetical protein